MVGHQHNHWKAQSLPATTLFPATTTTIISLGEPVIVAATTVRYNYCGECDVRKEEREEKE